MNINSRFSLSSVSPQSAQTYDKIQQSTKNNPKAIEQASISAISSKQKRAARIDKIEISHSSHEEPEMSELMKLRNQLVSDLQKDTDIEKIHSLKAKIALGQYSVDTRELSETLLDL